MALHLWMRSRCRFVSSSYVFEISLKVKSEIDFAWRSLGGVHQYRVCVGHCGPDDHSHPSRRIPDCVLHRST